jgi:hypothetical protein
MGRHLMSVHLTGRYLMGVHLMGRYLMGRHLMGKHMAGVWIPLAKELSTFSPI